MYEEKFGFFFAYLLRLDTIISAAEVAGCDKHRKLCKNTETLDPNSG